MSNETTFPSVLHGRLWHTTSLERYQMIITEGYILPEPPIPDEQRWKTCRGPHYYPYVRSLSGVSLFDFEGFAPDNYSEEYPNSRWRAFVPYREAWGQAVWIELDRRAIAKGFINGKMLLERRDQEGALRHDIMPIIEAAHLGPIPIAAFRRVLICGNDGVDFDNIDIYLQKYPVI
jgi:hypothetical protein